MLKRISVLVVISTLILSLFSGCGCSNKEITDEEKDNKRKEIQSVIDKEKMPLSIKRDELGFELTANKTQILLRNKSNTKDKNTTLILYHLKWTEEDEKDKDKNIRKLINKAQDSTKKAPKFKKGKIKKINKKAMFVQYGRVKKGKYKGWYGSQISFQDETDKNNKELLTFYYISKNKKAIKQTKRFVQKYLNINDKQKETTSKTSDKSKDLGFDELGK